MGSVWSLDEYTVYIWEENDDGIWKILFLSSSLNLLNCLELEVTRSCRRIGGRRERRLRRSVPGREHGPGPPCVSASSSQSLWDCHIDNTYNQCCSVSPYPVSSVSQRTFQSHQHPGEVIHIIFWCISSWKDHPWAWDPIMPKSYLQKWHCKCLNL